jgi:NAD(P)-dependent dehydrogenase (short-subunit alcohol dehydrogenase family)
VGTHLEKHLEEARVEGENVRFVVPAGSLVSLAVDLEGICFLAEPKASFVTGADYRVDGGLLAALGVRLPE